MYVSIDNGLSWGAASASVGSKTWSLARTLSGSNTLQVKVSDSAGNDGPVRSQSYVIDTTAPSAPVIQSALPVSIDPYTWGSSPLVLSGTSGADASVVVQWKNSQGVVSLERSVYLANSGTWSLSFLANELPLGLASATVFTRDPAGNESSTSTIACTVLNNYNDPPVVTLVSAVLTTAGSTVSLTGSNLSISDAEAYGSYTISLSATNGVLNASASTGLDISGNGTSSLTLSGAYSALQTYLSTANNISFSGNVKLVLTDNAGGGSGVAMSDTALLGLFPSGLSASTPVLAMDTLRLRQGLPGSGLGVAGSSQVVASDFFSVVDAGNTSPANLTLRITPGSNFNVASGSSVRNAFEQDSYFYNTASALVSAVTSNAFQSVVETDVITFAALTSGQNVQVGGLTFTANQSITAAQVASAFASLANGATTQAGITYGSFSGSLSGWTSGAALASTSIAFSSTSAGDVTN
ncbi:MAG: hypothetical protein EBZ76_12635, partial [Synechococcaceae bacterium WB9_2_170]|nr:hypothetical protein [Synechococcaceae bacterium WB9_2_170]